MMLLGRGPGHGCIYIYRMLLLFLVAALILLPCVRGWADNPGGGGSDPEPPDANGPDPGGGGEDTASGDSEDEAPDEPDESDPVPPEPDPGYPPIPWYACYSEGTSGDPVITATGAFVLRDTDSYLQSSSDLTGVARCWSSTEIAAGGSPATAIGRWKEPTVLMRVTNIQDPEDGAGSACVGPIEGEAIWYKRADGSQLWVPSSAKVFEPREYDFGYDEAGTGYKLWQNRTIDRKFLVAAYVVPGFGSPVKVWYFTNTGRLTAVTNGQKVLYTYAYDLDDQVTKVSTPGTKAWGFDYDAGNRLTRLANPDSGATSYWYDDDDNLTKVVGTNGREVSYAYDANHLITAVHNGNGEKVVGNLYDSTGRVTRQWTEHGDYLWTFSGVGGTTVDTVDTSGNGVQYQYDEHLRLTKKVVATNRGVREGEGDYAVVRLYDDLRLTKVVYARGTEKQLYYDVYGCITRKVVDPDPQTANDERVYQYEYETINHRVTRQVDPAGNPIILLRDANGPVTRLQKPTVTLGQASPQTVIYDYAYDSSGQVTRAVDPQGMVSTFTYDSDGDLLTSVVDPGGLDLTTVMRYDTLGNLTQSVSPDGSKQWFYYAPDNRITRKVRVLDNADPSKQYAENYYYDGASRCVSKVIEHKDQDGSSMSPATYVVRWQYDSQGYLTHRTFTVDGANTVTRGYYRDGSGRSTKVILENGKTEETTYDERRLVYEKKCSECGAPDTTFDYDGNGNVLTRTDGVGNRTVFVYDGFDRVTRKPHYDSGSPPNLLYYEELGYDANGNVTRRTIRGASGTVVQRTASYFDELDRLYEKRTFADPGSSEGDNDARTVYLYDKLSRMTKVQTYLSGTDASPTLAETSYFHDWAGRLTRQVDAEGAAVSYLYSASGQLTKKTDPEAAETTYAYDRLGRVTRVTNALGRYVVGRYDWANNLLTRTSYDSGGTALAKAAYDYNAESQATKVRRFADPAGAADDGKDWVVLIHRDAAGLVTKTVAQNGSESTVSYDEVNKVTCRRDALGNRAEYVYDDNNNVITAVSYEIDQVTGTTKTFTAAALYDGLSRLTRVTNQGADGDISQSGDNGVTVYYYDALGHRTRVTDAESVSTDSRYDATGRLTRVTEDAGGLAGNTDSAYDRASRLTKLIDALGQSTAYAYDKRGRTTRTTYADHDAASDTVDLSYAAGGLVTKRLDQRGISTVYLYDLLGELTKKQDDPSSPTIVEEYGYDALGRVTCALKGTSGNADADSETYWYYDSLGRLTRESQEVAESAARAFSFFYDKAGSRTRMEYPGASRVISYTYDALNRISLLREGATPKTFAVHKYVGPGRLSERRYNKVSDGSTEVTTLSVSYDGIGMVTRYEHRNSTPATVVGFVYGRDKVGNPNYKQRLHQSGKGDEYKYAGLYRVTATVYDDAAPATPTAPTAGAGSDIFYYDGVGNRTRAYERSTTATDYLHNPVNEYTKVAGTEWQYDAAGNLTKDNARYYYWDYENGLARVTDQEQTPNVLADFRYDALGRLIEKVASGVTTRYYLDGFRALEETEGTQSPTVERQYAYGLGIDDVLVLFDKTGDGYDAYYYLSDPLWTVEALVDENASVVEGYAYDVYGKPTIKTGAGNDSAWFTSDDATASASAKGNPYMFTARNWHQDIALQYNRARWYAPTAGRWTTRDPIGYWDSTNLYQYALSTPVLWVDSFGLAVGDWWDARTYWVGRAGICESLSDQSDSMGEALYINQAAQAAANAWYQSDALYVPMSADQRYGKSALGQSANADPVTYYGTRASVGVASAAAIGAAAVGAIEYFGVEVVDVSMRSTLGKDLAKSFIVKYASKITGATVAVEHIVIKGGEVIHQHCEWEKFCPW